MVHYGDVHLVIGVLTVLATYLVWDFVRGHPVAQGNGHVTPYFVTLRVYLALYLL
jgi:hypothetical protein